MYTEELTPFPKDSNPFNHDQFHMGTHLGSNCVIMHPNHSHEKCDYLIIVNIETGERLRVALNSKEHLQPSVVEQLIS